MAHGTQAPTAGDATGRTTAPAQHSTISNRPPPLSLPAAMKGAVGLPVVLLISVVAGDPPAPIKTWQGCTCRDVTVDSSKRFSGCAPLRRRANQETDRPAPTGFGYCAHLICCRRPDIKVGCEGAYDQQPPQYPGWDACDIADADHTQESLENWDKENITALALRKGLTQEFIDKTFKGLFPTRKIARELLPLLKPKEERKGCEGPQGRSDKTCDELGEELLVAGRKEPPDVAEVARLIGLGASASYQNERGNNALIACAGDSGNLELAELLLKNGADVNVGMDDPNDIDFGQWMALHRASTNGHVEMVKLLVSHGAELEHSAGKEWRTPLMLAAKRGHSAVVKVLAEAGADVEYHSGNGLTPLMEAASARRGSETHAATVGVLIEAGADVGKENYANGNTALHYAAATASLDAAKMLVAAGANLTAENHEGYTPMDYAHKHKWNYDMRVWFRELGAECTLGESCRDDSGGRPEPPKSSSQRIEL